LPTSHFIEEYICIIADVKLSVAYCQRFSSSIC